VFVGGAVGPENGAKTPQKILKIVILWPVTPWVLVDVFFISLESSMSFRRDD
jgi:hypothetical protein